MRNATSASKARPYIAWTVAESGKVGPCATVDKRTLQRMVRDAGEVSGLVLTVTHLAGTVDDLADVYDSLVGHVPGASRQSRPLTGPYVVPKSWHAPIGSRGFIIGDLRPGARTQALVLAAYPCTLWQLDCFVGAVENRKDAWDMTTPAHLRTLLERLIAVDAGPRQRWPVRRAQKADLKFAPALRHCEALVDQYEDHFRAGADLTHEEHIRIEQLLQELVLRAGTFATPGMEAERKGLVSRLSRLLDAQAARDGNGALQRVLAALTALVLVPTLVAGVFGANVPIPFEPEPAMRWAMFGLMAWAGVTSFLLLDGLRPSTATRRLELHWPGGRQSGPNDPQFFGRLAASALVGAALGVVVEAAWRLWTADVPGMAESTTSLVVGAAVLGVLELGRRLVAQDLQERTRLHAALVAVLAASTAALASGMLGANPWQIGAALLVSLLCMAVPWRAGAWLSGRLVIVDSTRGRDSFDDVLSLVPDDPDAAARVLR